MKKRQCTLCDDGKVMTDVAKDKAICHACARELMDGECNHGLSCDCPCHRGIGILHSMMGCCMLVSCPICGKEMDTVARQDHMATCHKTLHEMQGGQ